MVNILAHGIYDTHLPLVNNDKRVDEIYDSIRLMSKSLNRFKQKIHCFSVLDFLEFLCEILYNALHIKSKESTYFIQQQNFNQYIIYHLFIGNINFASKPAYS